MYSVIFTLAAIGTSIVNADRGKVPYMDSITAQGLLGTHFGIPFFNATFDYVVIGGGTAGLTIAARLAENTQYRVAVIEAGGFSETDNGNLSEVPAYNSYWVGKHPLSRNPLIDWGTYTEPMLGLGGSKILYSSGKTLGGGSSRNSLTYHRSTKGAFSMWANMVGDKDWTWENLLPYFKKSISFHPPDLSLRLRNATTSYDINMTDADGGPLQVSYPNHANAFSSWGVEALKELGLNETIGNIGGKLLGYCITPNTIDASTQSRSSSETSFLRTALMHNSNLVIYTRTIAKRVNFDSEKHASSVLVDTAGVQYILTARREVVISAGALRSPQILMTSGIGPAHTLESLNIPIVANRSGVGQNMQDHVLFGASYEVNVATHSRLQDENFAAEEIGRYQINRTGLLTNSGLDVLGWEKLPPSYRTMFSNWTRESLDSLPDDWPELELIFPDAYGGFLDDFVSGAPLDGKNYATIGVGLQAPFSRGNVTIQSPNTSDNPIVSPNLLGDPRDLEVAIQAFKRIREIASTHAMKSIIIGAEVFPGPNVTELKDIQRYLEHSANTIYHASCTCAMGRSGDEMAVVDSKGKVIGVRALRVVDASIFPVLVPGHPQSNVYAVAEKIAQDILSSAAVGADA